MPSDEPLVECVVNVSEGRDPAVLAALAEAAGAPLLDRHHDVHHNRSVWTLAGPLAAVQGAARRLVTEAVRRLDLRHHVGVHPRLGTVDVVPWVALAVRRGRLVDGDIDEAVRARDAFAAWASGELALPCFLYGPERSLPDVRRRAWIDLAPDTGPATAHPTAGAACVGARPLLVAYNLWLVEPDLALARRVASEIRSPTLRTLGLAVGDRVQVSCNLVDPLRVGPADAFDAVTARTAVARAELVGLVPAAVLDAVDPARWPSLDLRPEGAIEARLQETGLDGGRFAARLERR